MKSQFRSLKWAWLAAASLLLVLGATPSHAVVGTIVGSKHDFSSTGPSVTYKSATQTQVCIYCHAPHNTASTSLLWNHTASAATYTLYANSTMKATLAQPAGVSKLCLSCHDGTIAIDSFGGAAGTATNKAAGTVNLGTSLADDHPIGFAYNAALVTANPGLKAVSTAATIGTGNAGTIESKLLVGTAGVATMECSSCHDVHNSTAGTAVEPKLLKITTVGSALCTTCHLK